MRLPWDGVCEGWIADGFVPMLDGQLGGDEGCAAFVAVFDDLEEVASLFAG